MTPAPPPVGHIEGDMFFAGGDPSDQTNWHPRRQGSHVFNKEAGDPGDPLNWQEDTTSNTLDQSPNAGGMLQSFLKGAGSGVASTVKGAYDIAHKAMSGRTPGGSFGAIPEAPDWLKNKAANVEYDSMGNPIEPSLPFTIGRLGEQAAEFFVPNSIVGKAAKLIKGGSTAADLAKAGIYIAGGAASSGAVEALQTGGDMDAAKKAALIGGGAGALAGAISYLPTVEKAGNLFASIAKKVGPVPIDVRGPGQAALEMQDVASRGGSLPKVVKDFVRRATDPTKGPITYAEARDFYSNATSLSAQESMAAKPNTARLLGKFRDALDDSLTKAADQAGMADDYNKAMNMYHDSMRMQRAKKVAIDLAKKGAFVGGVGLAAKAGYDVYRAGDSK